MFNLDKIKSLFVVDEESKPSAADPKKMEAEEMKAPPSVKKVVKESTEMLNAEETSEANLEDQKKTEEKFLNSLLSTLQNHDQEGFDYLEFKTSLRSLKDIQPDEATRYQSAFAIAKGSMGLDKSKLVNSAKHYMNILVNERNEFMKVVASRVAKNTDGHDAGIQTRQKEIENLRAQIEQMTKAIDQKTKEMAQMKESAQLKSAKIARTKRGFESAFAKSYGVIEDDLKKIDQYLK